MSIDSQYPMCYYHYAMTKQEWLQIRMGAEEKEELQKLADHWGVSMSDLVREAIDLYRRFHAIKPVAQEE